MRRAAACVSPVLPIDIDNLRAVITRACPGHTISLEGGDKVCQRSGLILLATLSRDQPAFHHIDPLETGRSRATTANQPPLPRPQPLEHPLEARKPLLPDRDYLPLVARSLLPCQAEAWL
jgi:hypothetical protein